MRFEWRAVFVGGPLDAQNESTATAANLRSVNEASIA